MYGVFENGLAELVEKGGARVAQEGVVGVVSNFHRICGEENLNISVLECGWGGFRGRLRYVRCCLMQRQPVAPSMLCGRDCVQIFRPCMVRRLSVDDSRAPRLCCLRCAWLGVISRDSQLSVGEKEWKSALRGKGGAVDERRISCLDSAKNIPRTKSFYKGFRQTNRIVNCLREYEQQARGTVSPRRMFNILG
ncbi:uncharacterized protein BKA78DRAFT_299371 [Phyllosticta capitalensis]|uniref:uncharacterized protein n=1 Tax=Phyllosticta capitalensis TaxID=121624 RepID=UPI00312F69BC